MTGRGRTEGNLATDKGEDQTETVLDGVEELECDTD